MKRTLPLAVAAIGGILFVTSFLWGFIFPAANVWTAEKSQEMKQLSANVRSLTMKVKAGESNPANYGEEELQQVKQEFELAKEKLEAMQAEFKTVSESPDKMANMLRWIGMMTAIAGLLGFRALNSG